ncbi:ECF-type sigma factor [Rothia kristinae]|uniref:ECF-type sigma factor n=1 Tax=Rothia kristinae TaxID=37923 RepID=UPI0011A91336|nr:ECF-type sigma factor [Rothia kristinae]
MAAQRKSATKAKAREKARAAAAARIEREQKIMAASEAFFAKTLARETEREKLREQIEKLSEQLAALNGVVPEAAEEVQTMKAQGLPNKEIAELLELTPSEVTAYLRASKKAANSGAGSDDEGSTPEESPADSEEEKLTGTPTA